MATKERNHQDVLVIALFLTCRDLRESLETGHHLCLGGVELFRSEVQGWGWGWCKKGKVSRRTEGGRVVIDRIKEEPHKILSISGRDQHKK